MEEEAKMSIYMYYSVSFEVEYHVDGNENKNIQSVPLLISSLSVVRKMITAKEIYEDFKTLYGYSQN